MDTPDLPVPDAIHPMLKQLQEALVLEVKYQPNLQFPTSPQYDEITIDCRDRSAHVLRCLKVWYDLPSEVFFMAINVMDRFLTKMRARLKHMACISVSAFYITAYQMAQNLDVDDLVAISQCRCTGGDLRRMADVMCKKLEWVPGTQPITTLTFLRLFLRIFHTVASQIGLGEIYTSIIVESELLLVLEMVICDCYCTNRRLCEVALALFCAYLKIAIDRSSVNTHAATSAIQIAGPSSAATTDAPIQLLRLIEFAAELRKICKISEESFYVTQEAVSIILIKYNAQEQTPHRQRLIWNLSPRTTRILRPTEQFISVLPVIAEHAPISSPIRIRKPRKFSRRHGNKRR